MLVTRKSMISGVETTMDIPITQEQFDLLRPAYFPPGKFHVPGQLIQNVFPDLTPDQREFLMTGITPEEWDEMFLDCEADYKDHSGKESV